MLTVLACHDSPHEEPPKTPQILDHSGLLTPFSFLFASCSCGDPAVASLPAAGEPAPSGPDPRSDGEEGAASAAQHRVSRTVSSTQPVQPGLCAHFCPDQLPLTHPRSLF